MLQKIAAVYELLKNPRFHAYYQAAENIKNREMPFYSFLEIEGIGNSIKNDIEQFLKDGFSRRLDEIQDDEDYRTVRNRIAILF